MSDAQLNLVMIRRQKDGNVEWIPLDAPTRIEVVQEEDYALIDRGTYEAPASLVVKRDGADLTLEVENAEVLVLEGFFTAFGVAFFPTPDIARGAGPFSGAPLTPYIAAEPNARGEEIIWTSRADEETLVVSAPATGNGGPGGAAILIGGLAAGGLGLAVAGGGGGGGGGSPVSSGSTGTPLDTTSPTITSGSSAAPVEEGSGAGQVIYTATATDASPVAWDLQPGGDAEAFSIDASSGEVTLLDNPDFETQPSYSFTVLATDSAGNRSSQTVALAINDTDDAAPLITSGATAAPIEENSGPGQLVYVATATDDQSAVTWSLEAIDDGDAFAIDADNGEVSLLEDPDFEAQPSYSFTVVATDSEGNSSSQAVFLAISDVDENPPAITSGDTAAALDENSGAEQIVYDAEASDESPVTWSLLPEDDAEAFVIDPESGEVTLLANPDFEAQSSYSFTVVAADAAGNSSSQAVSLAINELDDDGPAVVSVELSEAVGATNGRLNAGDTVRVTVTMSESTFVDTAGGTPRIALRVGPETVFASYTAGSGTPELSFEYEIQDGDRDNNGIRIPANSLELNGGTLEDASGNAADLRHSAVGNDPDFRVDTAAPTVSSTEPDDGETGVAVDDQIELRFSESVFAGNGNIVISNGDDRRLIDIQDESQIRIEGDLVIINPAANLEGDSSYVLEIEAGALADAAGNTFTGLAGDDALNFATEAIGDADVDTTVVVFDLVQGSSSDHSERTFDGDVSYDIYVRVRSDSASLSTNGGGPGTWGTWQGADNLGSDDRVILVGNGGPVEGRFFAANRVSVRSTAVDWSTPFRFDAGSLEGRTFVRATGFGQANQDDARLFRTALPSSFLGNQGGQASTMLLTSMPAGILTSQGLA